MLNTSEIISTIEMIRHQCLDIRTITMGISLRDCITDSADKTIDKMMDKIRRKADKLVATGEDIEAEYGIPIVNKRISVTPVSIVAEASGVSDYAPFAKALDKAAKDVGVNFIGGFSALVHKGMTPGERFFIERCIP